MLKEPCPSRVEPDLVQTLEELREFEPIFHRERSGRSCEDFRRLMAEDYWEVGASGRRYDRDFILQQLEEHPPADAQAAGWRCWDFGLRRLGQEAYLLTYTLDQSGRVTRRATIWDKSSGPWRILYHQGTLASADEDDTDPPES
ncbi:MAG TPA: DUF4440 domain-containing protein [Terracidiphilus sp.]|nr:DUF4440 domain-containing protein [Terracidiphilus sp.]